MKIVIAMDSFKGGLSAADACRHVACGLGRSDAGATLILKPMADGGEGTAAALLAARSGGTWLPVTVAGPLPDRSVEAGYAWFGDDRTAIIEMAVANGLPLLTERERNPLKTSTYGTGQLIKAAREHGARRILLAVGGSATVDGGVGAATALGWQFLDSNDQPVAPGGGHLRDITRIVAPATRSGVSTPETRIEVLCDVTNRLLGARGAAAVFAPQKGAAPDAAHMLEAGLSHLAKVVRAQFGFDMTTLTGGGAAGGLAAGAAAFLNAELTPGIDAIMAAVSLGAALQDADWCLTGEGSFDTQSLDGKVVSGVAAAARQADVPAVVIAGRVKADPDDYQAHGIQAALATHDPDMPLDEVIRREPELLQETAANWLRELQAKNGDWDHTATLKGT